MARVHWHLKTFHLIIWWDLVSRFGQIEFSIQIRAKRVVRVCWKIGIKLFVFRWEYNFICVHDMK